MKVLMTTDLYKPTINGVVASIETLKCTLEALGHEVKIMTLAETTTVNGDKDVFSTVSYSIGKLYPGARIALSADLSIYLKILAWGPDIIHSHCEFSSFRITKEIAKQLKIPIVHTYHTVYEDYTHYFSPNKKWGKKLAALYSRHILKQTEQVIAPTEKVHNLLENYGVSQPITIIPTGIFLKKYAEHLSDEELNRLKTEHSIPKNRPILLFVGRLAKEKNLSEILIFLSKIKTKEYAFLIVGDGPYKNNLQQEAKALNLNDVVCFTGMISPDKVADYYKLGDVFLNASTSETQGLTYIEASASSLPLLCRKDDCLKNVVLNKESGLLYENFDEFKEYFLLLLKDPNLRNEFGDKAQKLVQQSYSAEVFSKRVEQVYLKAIRSFDKRNDSNQRQEKIAFPHSIRFRS